MSASEYLAWEREQLERHEFLRATSLDGGRLAAARLSRTDQRIAARDGEHSVHADASIVCAPMELAQGLLVSQAEAPHERRSLRGRCALRGAFDPAADKRPEEAWRESEGRTSGGPGTWRIYSRE